MGNAVCCLHSTWKTLRWDRGSDLPEVPHLELGHPPQSPLLLSPSVWMRPSGRPGLCHPPTVPREGAGQSPGAGPSQHPLAVPHTALQPLPPTPSLPPPSSLPPQPFSELSAFLPHLPSIPVLSHSFRTHSWRRLWPTVVLGIGIRAGRCLPHPKAKPQ